MTWSLQKIVDLVEYDTRKPNLGAEWRPKFELYSYSVLCRMGKDTPVAILKASQSLMTWQSW